MNHCVPDFEMDDDYSTPTSSGLSRSKKPFLPEDDIMELLWQNGQVVTQSQSQRSSVMRKSSPPSKYDALLPPDMEIRLSQSESRHDHVQLHEQHQHLFMQEDEMVSWLQHPLVDDPSLDPNFSSDLFYPQLSDTTTNSSLLPVRLSHFNEIRPPASMSVLPVPASRPPVPPARSTETNVNVPNFGHFSRHSKATVEFGPSCSKTAVDSCDTPAVGKNPCISDIKRSSPEETSYGNIVSGYVSGNGGKEIRCDVTVISSPGDSSASGEPSIPARAMAASDDRKRKGVEVDDTECQSEDVEFESGDGKKHARGSSTKRSRAAEVHNLSERRRRDRINEKMKALQELIPRCNKSDKASMLDEAIEYLKSLQLQVQMMSMGCGMVPMMFPGMQQYMPPMGMGIGMGMGMGMEMGLNRPIMPFPNVLSGSNMTTPTAAAHHLGPRFPMPAFQMPTVPTTEPLRGQATNQLDYMFQPFPTQNPNQSRAPNFPDPYQQYFGSHQMQLTLQQNPVAVQPSTSKPSSSRGPENPENHQSDSLKEAT